MIEQIEAKLNAVWEKRRTVYPCHTNRASQIGTSCLRQLVYYRTSWDKQTLPELSSVKIFDEGNMQEEAVKRLLMDAGFQIVEAQRAVADDLLKEYNISGHLDFYLGGLDGEKPVVCEVKSMNPHIFDTMHSLDDFERYPWTRKYKAQMMIYLLGAGEERGLFILKNKSTGELRFIEAQIDLVHAESLLERAKTIEAHVKDGTLPDRIDDAKECEHCPFLAHCAPDKVRQAAAMIETPEFVSKVDRREELDPLRREFDALDSEIKDTVKTIPEDQVVVGGKYLIEKKPFGKGVRVEIKHL